MFANVSSARIRALSVVSRAASNRSRFAAAALRVSAVCALMLVATLIAAPLHAAGFSPGASLTTARYLHTATLLPSGKVLVAGGSNAAYLASAELYDPATNTWSSGGTLGTARNQHTATLLPSGKVLVAGGRTTGGGYIASAELYDPVANSWSPAGTLTTARGVHSATLLASGKVLVAGGYNGTTYMLNAELYDPVANSWSTCRHTRGRTLSTHRDPAALRQGAGGRRLQRRLSCQRHAVRPGGEQLQSAAASLTTTRRLHIAIVLPSGKVLVSGGYNGSYLTSGQLYDPSSNTWSAAGALTTARSYHAAALLPSGKVLVAGGQSTGNAYIASAELYDPATNTYSAAGALAATRGLPSATLLATGRLLIAAGYNSTTYLATTELYDPTVPSMSAASSMAYARIDRTAKDFKTGSETPLPSGKVLVTSLEPSELYDPATNTWSSAGTIGMPGFATLLPSGKVLVVGANQLYDPATNTWSATAAPTYPRGSGSTVTLLASGKVLAAGGGTSPTTSEVYDPATNNWAITGEFLKTRALHTATLLPSGKVLVAGGLDAAGSFSTCELYDPATNTWSAAGSMTYGRYDHTATVLLSGKVLIAGGFGSDGFEPELYDPATNTFSAAGQFVGGTSGRWLHTATLLPSGKVLVAGGQWNSSVPQIDTQIYDPATNSWTVGPLLATARRYHTAALLLSGKVLIAGGLGTSSALSSAELFDPGLAPVSTLQPVLSSANSFLLQTSQFAATSPGSSTDAATGAVTATGFAPRLEASGAAINNSATNMPVFQVQRVDNDQTLIVAKDPSVNLSDTVFTGSADAFAGFPPGPVRVRVWVNGVPSADRYSTFAVTPAKPAAPTAVGGTLQATLNFTPVSDDGGAPVTGYTATASPGGATAACTAPCASIGFNPIAAGTYSFTVVATNAAGNGPTSASSNSVIVRSTSTTSLVSSDNPSTFGQSVTFTATVTGSSPTGTVTFNDGATPICSAVALSSGSAQCSTSTLAFGSRSITAIYSGDAYVEGSTSNTVSQQVNQAASSTTLVSDANPSTFNQSVTFTATVAGQPTGTVTFKDGATPICSAVALSSGSAGCTTSALSVGSHSITAAYSGDGNYINSTSNTVTQQVDQAVSATSLMSATNPSTFNQSITFTATVTGQSATGTVTFKDGATPICTAVSLTSGSAGCTTSSLSAGSHSITAVYNGDTNNAISTSNTVTQQVDQVLGPTSLQSALNPSKFNQSVAFTATVTGVSPTGTMTFKDGATPICTAVTMTGGSAGCTTSTLSVGSHSITAAYSGDMNNAPSTSNTVTQVVNKATSTTSFTTECMKTFVENQPFTMTASVNGATPTGDVTFSTQDNISVLCDTMTQVPLNAGTASCTTDALTVSGLGSAQTYILKSNYSGDANNSSSVSSTIVVTALKASGVVFRNGFEIDLPTCPIE